MTPSKRPIKFAPFMLFQKPPGRGDDRTVLQGELEAIVEAEAQGYDGIFLAEHIFSPYSIASSPASLAGAAIGRTRSIRIGIAVVVLPLAHPLRIAADWATLDVLSDGRVELGVGRGYNWFEFDSLGIDLESNTRRFIEEVEIIRGAWTEERVTFHGEFYDIEATEVLPKPLQKPYPPMFYASSTKESAAMAGRVGLGSCSSLRPGPAELKERHDIWVTASREAGRSEEEMGRLLEHLPTQRVVWVAETDRQAEEECRAMVQSFSNLAETWGYPGSGYPGRSAPDSLPQAQERIQRRTEGGSMSWDALVENYGVIAGSPATVRSRLDELLDQAPLEYIMTWGSIGGPHPDDLRRSQRLFAEKVMPHFK